MAEEIPIEEYKKAYREIVVDEEKRGFLAHLTVYVLVNAMFVAINFIYSSRLNWSLYPLLGWGSGVSMHYLYSVRWMDKKLNDREAKADYIVKGIKNK